MSLVTVSHWVSTPGPSWHLKRSNCQGQKHNPNRSHLLANADQVQGSMLNISQKLAHVNLKELLGDRAKTALVPTVGKGDSGTLSVLPQVTELVRERTETGSHCQLPSFTACEYRLVSARDAAFFWTACRCTPWASVLFSQPRSDLETGKAWDVGSLRQAKVCVGKYHVTLVRAGIMVEMLSPPSLLWWKSCPWVTVLCGT